MSLRKAAAEQGIAVKVRNGPPGQFQVFRDGVKLFDYKEAAVLPPLSELVKLILS